ncbi:Mor transcription activator family protein [Psychrobacter pygoscelis]|uniref:Mor transcription activator family protein n=1 Tax=Psychrobacter pygoscelis TaxID=2488563 RepID=UPI00103E4423|nr:Mor transcription activator family protein [Psychrobacter pygoscelis]
MNSRVTKTYQDLTMLLGVDAADKLVAEYRGQELYIPEPSRAADHKLSELLGDETARRLCHYWQGDILTIPMQQAKKIAARNAEMIKKHEAGTDKSALAKAYNLHVRTVRKIIEQYYNEQARAAYKRQQLQLFDQ